MKITLRKANALQQNINEALRGIKIEPLITISEFEDAEAKLAEAKAEVFGQLARTVDLNYTLYAIRGLVGAANAAEIDGLLTRIAHMDKTIQFNNFLLGCPKQTSLDVLKGKLDKIRALPEDSVRSVYSSRTEVSTGIFSENELKGFKSAVLSTKKDKQKLQDKVLELNIKTEIELPEDVVAILTKEGLI